jgi:hypothetical protein
MKIRGMVKRPSLGEDGQVGQIMVAFEQMVEPDVVVSADVG